MAFNQPQTITTARGQFGLRDAGDKQGPALVLLHGWPESSWCWQGVAAALPASLRIIAPDLRGLGDSERSAEPSAYRKDELAADVWSILDALGVTDCVLVGHDWGGVVAQEMALAAPQRLRHLIIANIFIINNVRTNQQLAATGTGRHQWYQYFLMTPLAELMIPGHERAWLEVFLRDRHGALLPEATLDEYERCYRKPGTAASAAELYRQLRVDVARWSTLATHRFEIPSSLIYGERDKAVIPAYFEGLERCFASIERHNLDAGHFVQEERAADCAAIIARCCQQAGILTTKGD